MLITFAGRSVLVTGAVRGIGRGIAHAFAARGAAVHAVDILADDLAAVAAEARPAEGGSLSTHVLDVTDAAAVKSLVDRIAAASPSKAVDIAVHSAGGVRGQSARPIEEITPEDWRAIQAVNVDGAFHIARAVAPGMKAARQGRIIVISSRAGLQVSLTGIHGYGTAKAAQIGLVRQISAELGPYGVTVNSVAPGFMPTSPDYVRQWEGYGLEGQKALVERIAMRRLSRPDDVAHMVMFLASPFADYVTGQTICVTGGP